MDIIRIQVNHHPHILPHIIISAICLRTWELAQNESFIEKHSENINTLLHPKLNDLFKGKIKPGQRGNIMEIRERWGS